MEAMEIWSPIHIIGTVFVVFAWSRAFLRFRDDSMNAFELLLWSVIWAAVLIVLFLPNTTEFLADQLGIGRGVDVFIYGSIVILFYLVYRVYVKIEMLEREITKVVRAETLKDLPKDSKHHGSK